MRCGATRTFPSARPRRRLIRNYGTLAMMPRASKIQGIIPPSFERSSPSSGPNTVTKNFRYRYRKFLVTVLVSCSQIEHHSCEELRALDCVEADVCSVLRADPLRAGRLCPHFGRRLAVCKQLLAIPAGESRHHLVPAELPAAFRVGLL